MSAGGRSLPRAGSTFAFVEQYSVRFSECQEGGGRYVVTLVLPPVGLTIEYL